MVYRRHDVEFELAVRRRLEDARVDFDLFGAGAVEGFQEAEDTGFFASARGPVEEEVREVAAVCLSKD